MDEHSHFNKTNGSAHTKTFTPTPHIHNPTSFPSYSQPRTSYNLQSTNSNKDLNMHKE